MSYIEMGGVFMIPMLLIGLVAFIAATMALVGSFSSGALTARAPMLAGAVRHVAVFLLVMGVLSQAMGLYQALSAIEGVGGQIPPAMVAGGLKVSFIAPILGLIEFLVLYGMAAVVRTRSK